MTTAPILAAFPPPHDLAEPVLRGGRDPGRDHDGSVSARLRSHRASRDTLITARRSAWRARGRRNRAPCVNWYGSTVSGDRRAEWSGSWSYTATICPSAGARIGWPNPRNRFAGSVARTVRESRVTAVRRRASTATKSIAKRLAEQVRNVAGYPPSQGIHGDPKAPERQ
jgi:hypothetical protein